MLARSKPIRFANYSVNSREIFRSRRDRSVYGKHELHCIAKAFGAERTRAFLTLAKAFDDQDQELVLEALALAREADDLPSKASELSVLAPAFEGPMQAEIVDEALDAISQVHSVLGSNSRFAREWTPLRLLSPILES